jgi:5'-nucleotidase
MGLRQVMSESRPDLVLSGVNHGQNVAEDVTYSGTIAAAMEGTILGVRSIALSQAYGAKGRAAINWSCAETHAPGIIKRLIAEGIPEDILINVNFPDCLPEEVEGVSVSVQGRRNQNLLRIDPREDGRGKAYYWIAFQRGKQDPANGTDLKALADKRISITPLELDLTHEPTLTRLAIAFAG